MFVGEGATSALAQVMFNVLAPKLGMPAGRDPRRAYAPMLGASGSVNAMVALSILMFPTRTLYLYFLIPIPAAVFGVLFTAMEFFDAYQGQSTVANVAHLGGTVSGLLFWIAMRMPSTGFRRF